MKKIAIIGAGASGLFCAIKCAEKSIHVDIYEQNSKCAKKILVSGNGRCNIINTHYTQNDYYSSNLNFTNFALQNHSFEEFCKFTDYIGLELLAKEDGKVYPLSNEAKSVAELLEDKAKSLGVKFHTNTKITNVQKLQKNYDAIVIATGSEAASHLGGNRDGYDFAQSLGHTILPTYPSLVQLELEGDLYKKMTGSKVDGEVALYLNNKKATSISGDILFTNYGVSGFAILDISQMASEALSLYQDVTISLNLLPRYTAQKLSGYIMKRSELDALQTVLHMLHGLLPIKIAKTLLEALDIPHTSTLKQLNTKMAKKIANQILNWKFTVKTTHGFRHAEVSGGGIDTQEIDPHTMESLQCNNIYFIGEVLDVVGRRGGFNFAWAWASANLCAKAILRS